MKYRVLFSDRARKQLKKIDKYTSSLIIGWLEKILKVVKIQEYMEKDQQKIEQDNGDIELEIIE